MLWLATLNPAGRRGRKRRKVRLGRKGRGQFLKRARAKSRRAGRRTLTAWQRMVKKHGGVMQAVKARLAAGKGRRRKVTRHKSRRSAVSRARARSRSRKQHKEVNMARTRRSRRRRTSPHGRGRFLSRRNPSRRRRSRRANPLSRSRSGQFSRRGHRRLHLKGARGWHNPRRRRSYRRNSVIPVSWNPKRRRRSSRRRNPVLPFFAMNPSGAISGVVSRVKSFADVRFWTETALPATAGFLGAKVVGGIVYGFVGEKLMGLTGTEAHAPYVRIGSQALAAAGLSLLVSRFVGQKQGQAVFVGGVIAVTHALLKQVLGGTQIATAIGLDGLGDDLSSRMREAVQRRVEQNLRGYGAYATFDRVTRLNGGAGRDDGMGAYLNENALRQQGNFAPTPGADLRDYDVSRTETNF